MQLKRKAKRFGARVSRQAAKLLPATKGFGYDMPPERIVVDIYFDQKSLPEQAGLFFDHYEQANWSSPRGTPYRNWKLLAGDWIYNYEQAKKLERRLRSNALVSCVF